MWYDAPISPSTYTPLHYAVLYGCAIGIRALLTHGADVEARDLHGRMAVHIASQTILSALNQLTSHDR